MRARVRLGVAALSLVLAASSPAAQPQVVTKAVPQSAKAPKAFVAPAGPDAEALLLADRYVLRPDGTVVHEHTQRIKVASSLAINRDFGESRVVWDPSVETFEVLHNRTVRPNGEVVPGPENAIVDELPPGVHRNPLWSRLRRKVIVHTALEPGAVIEASWRVTRKAATPSGMTVAEPLAFPFPVAERTVEVEVPAGVELVVPAAGAGAPTAECTTAGGAKTCRFRLAKVAELPAEPGTPARVDVEPFAFASAGAHAAPGWASAELARRFDAAGQAPAGAVEAAKKAAGAELDRERALLAALTALGDAVNVSGSLPATHTDFAISPLASVWAAGWASPLEMAALQARVLGALGHDARPGLVLSGPEAGRAPGFALHDRAVLLVKAGDDDLRLYDPAAPAADKPLERTLGNAHLLVPGTPVDLAALSTPWRRRLAVSLTVDEKGAVKGELALATAGGATPHAGLVREPQKLAEKLAGGLLEGAKVTSVRATRVARGEAGLSASFEGTLPEKNARGLHALALSGVAGGVGDELPPLPFAGRLSPIALPGPGAEELDVTLTLPKGWSVAALPVAAKVTSGVGEVVVEAGKAEAAKTSVKRRLSLALRSAPAAEAGKVRELLAAWNAPDSRILFLRPPAQKP